jgi:hypothetical protein
MNKTKQVKKRRKTKNLKLSTPPKIFKESEINSFNSLKINKAQNSLNHIPTRQYNRGK